QYYIVAPESYFYYYSDGSYAYEFLSNRTIILYNHELPESPSEIEKATSLDFYIQYANGTRNATYRNGTIAIFQYNATNNTLTFVKYHKAPTAFFVDFKKETVTLDGVEFKKITFDN